MSSANNAIARLIIQTDTKVVEAIRTRSIHVRRPHASLANSGGCAI